jgi:hypothetical protein
MPHLNAAGYTLKLHPYLNAAACRTPAGTAASTSNSPHFARRNQAPKVYTEQTQHSLNPSL